MSELSRLLATAEAKRWCARWGCPTCGAHDLRKGLEQLVDQCGGIETLVQDASTMTSFPRADPYEFTLRWVAMRYPGNLQYDLGPSPAGRLYDAMRGAQRAVAELRAAHEARNDPAAIAAERARKKAERAARHQERLAAKVLRDNIWRERQASRGLESP